MVIFYIYEVPGEKNGATKDWGARYKYNFNKYLIEPIVIETMEGPDTPEMWQIVGDREWELADLNGYDRGTHYRVMCENGRVGGNNNNHPNSRSWNGKASEIAYIGIDSRKENGQYQSEEWKEFSRQKSLKTKTCPYCGVTQRVMNYGRYHGDKCKHKA